MIENQHVPFSGTLLLDAEEGSLDAAEPTWMRSGPQSKSFSGGQISLRNLVPGQYTLTLSANDSDSMSGSTVRHFEVLPILVPTASGTPNVDGFCSDQAYEAAADLLLVAGVEASLLHAGDRLYVCSRGMASSGNATPNIAGIRIDANNSADANAQSGDRGFFIGEDNLTFQTVGNGNSMPATASLAFGFTAYAEKTLTGWSAELQIDESLVGGWKHLAGLMLQTSVINHTQNTHNYPQTATFDHPNTWADASFGAAIVSPNRTPSAAAGTDQAVAPHEATSIYLDGTSSVDADLDPLTYA
ncbi:MAG TPA: hypothetical protein VD886_11935 [Herpetosiphonaceae bacterium]|nr:hypothetical protein [Herpetosiphonaceae bacterium]